MHQPTKKIRLLYVDDCESLRMVLKLALETQGYEVTLAEHGVDALQRIAGDMQKFPLIITDRIMPVMDGHEFIKHLRAQGYGGPILLITSALGASETVHYQQLGVSAILHKPFGLQDVYTAVARLLDPSYRLRPAGAEQASEKHSRSASDGQRRPIVPDAHARAVAG